MGKYNFSDLLLSRICGNNHSGNKKGEWAGVLYVFFSKDNIKKKDNYTPPTLKERLRAHCIVKCSDYTVENASVRKFDDKVTLVVFAVGYSALMNFYRLHSGI